MRAVCLGVILCWETIGVPAVVPHFPYSGRDFAKSLRGAREFAKSRAAQSFREFPKARQGIREIPDSGF